VIKAVPFLTREQIEDQATDLLLSYGAHYGVVAKPPIPADEILNTYLKVKFDFDNLSRLLQVDADVFGATWLDEGQVIIDESLDPTNHPEMIGRYNFTVGHETGHWQLHRVYFENDPNQQQLFQVDRPPAIVCRTSQAKERIEWQADLFSSCLLMPKMMILNSWNDRYGLERVSIEALRTMSANSSRLGRSISDDAMIEQFCKPLSREFQVSPIAMRIRLETLGVIMRTESPRLFALPSS
jgi:Zn-dependent peptidase ImmA (M78 family)